jgi:hypothetical protein
VAGYPQPRAAHCETNRGGVDRYRPDLEKAGIGDGRHAFEFELSASLVADLRHEIEVRRHHDGARLRGSPATLEPGPWPIQSEEANRAVA